MNEDNPKQPRRFFWDDEPEDGGLLIAIEYDDGEMWYRNGRDYDDCRCITEDTP